jgi:hypothetical protein
MYTIISRLDFAMIVAEYMLGCVIMDCVLQGLLVLSVFSDGGYSLSYC